MSRRATFASIPISDFIIPKYQRPLRSHWVKSLIKNFDPDKVGFLDVAPQDDKYATMNGQHRLEVLRHVGWQEAPCIVHWGLTEKEQAAFFGGQGDVLSLTRLDLHHADIFADKERAHEIQRIVESAGYIVSTGKGSGRPAHLDAVATVYSIRDRYNAGIASMCLSVSSDAWGLNVEGPSGHVLQMIATFLHRYRNHPYYQRERLVAALSNLGSRELKYEGQRIAGTLKIGYQLGGCIVILREYNKGLRSPRRLPEVLSD